MKKMPTVLVMSFVIFMKIVQGQMGKSEIQLTHNNEELLDPINFEVSKTYFFFDRYRPSFFAM